MQAKNESNWKRKGYLDKIYTSSEKQLINFASEPEILVWLIWSMKEAAYKANNRITGIKEYAPTKIKCTIKQLDNNNFIGFASYNNLEYQLKSYVCEAYIHTIALNKSSDFLHIKELIIRDYPSNYTNYVKEQQYLNAYEIIIKDEFGIPNLHNEITKKNKPMSISHHGNLLSLVFIKD